MQEIKEKNNEEGNKDQGNEVGEVKKERLKGGREEGREE